MRTLITRISLSNDLDCANMVTHVCRWSRSRITSHVHFSGFIGFSPFWYPKPETGSGGFLELS